MNQNWINSGPSWLIKPRIKIVNRKQKRIYEKQFNIAFKFYFQIEQDFLNTLFDEDTNLSYKDIYNKTLLDFTDSINRFDRSNSLYLLDINTYFFEEKYKPIYNN